MIGVILAGGSGSRLYPTTTSTNKHLLPIYDKPMIYYPLSTLLMTGLKRVVVVTSPENIRSFQSLIGDGSRLGIEVSWVEQTTSNGIVGALQNASNVIQSESALVILGDNFFFGGGFGQKITNLALNSHAKIWVKQVSNPKEYGVVTLSQDGQPIDIAEKPEAPKSNFAVTGLYYMPEGFIERANSVQKSLRGELEITSLINTYLTTRDLEVRILNRGTAWFDCGTPERLSMVSDFVKILQERAGQIIGSPEEAAYRANLITKKDLLEIISDMPNSSYQSLLAEIEIY